MSEIFFMIGKVYIGHFFHAKVERNAQPYHEPYKYNEGCQRTRAEWHYLLALQQ